MELKEENTSSEPIHACQNKGNEKCFVYIYRQKKRKETTGMSLLIKVNDKKRKLILFFFYLP